MDATIVWNFLLQTIVRRKFYISKVSFHISDFLWYFANGEEFQNIWFKSMLSIQFYESFHEFRTKSNALYQSIIHALIIHIFETNVVTYTWLKSVLFGLKIHKEWTNRGCDITFFLYYSIKCLNKSTQHFFAIRKKVFINWELDCF